MMKEAILYDYRGMIVEEIIKGTDKKEHWETWAEWNILRKTMKYELENRFKDVEGYSYVKKSAFSQYCGNFGEEYRTADIMNGWWYCFKELLGITSRKSSQLEALLEECQNIGDDMTGLVELLKTKLRDKYLMSDYDQDEICKALLRLLKVVYTIGNMTPAPINPQCTFENWEYKLKKYGKLYHDYKGDIEILLFQDYCENEEIKVSPKTEDFKKDPAKYMNERVRLILKRGYRILTRGSKMEDKELDELFGSLL